MSERKMRKICNVIAVAMFGISTIMLFRYSELPNFFGISFMEKPKEISSIGMSLYTSFVVTAVFYFLMNFIPDYVKSKEKENEELPKRIAIQRDVQLFLSRYFRVWNEIIKYADNDKNNNELLDIDHMFDNDFVRNITIKVPLLELSNSCNPSGQKILWKDYLHNELSDLINRGNRIIANYSGGIPDIVIFYLHYLVNEDKTLAKLYRYIDVFYDEITEQNSVFDLLEKNEKQLELSKTRKCLKYLYDWVNSEYEYIIEKGGKEYSDTIFRVDI